MKRIEFIIIALFAISNITAQNNILARASKHLNNVPHPIACLHTEGTLPHQGIYDQSIIAERDFILMRDAALAWRLSGDRRYVEQVDTFLRAWTNVYMPSYNPIDETRFDAFIQAYMLTSNVLSLGTRKATQNFLRTLAMGYIKRSYAHLNAYGVKQWISNWQSHRVKIMTLSVAALKDSILMDKVHNLFLIQIANNVRTDGSVEDYEDRDALHYVVYDLEPLTLAAIAARSFGGNWLHEKAINGATLAKALDWLVPYAKGTKKHQDFVHTHAAFDKKRAAAGLPGYSGQWNPTNAGTLYWQAARLDPKYYTLAKKLLDAEPDWLPFL